MARCPNGHETQATDYCDQCGMPMTPPVGQPTAVASQPPVTSSTTTSVAESCPNCGAPRVRGALFCESCGYDYTTGALPQQDLRTELGLPPVGTGNQSGATKQAASESTTPGSATPEATPDSPTPAVPTPAASTPGSPTSQVAADAPSSPSGPVSAPTDGGAIRSKKPHRAWVAEVWVDPQWHAFQESTDPLPPLGPARIVPLKESALIGRRSETRKIYPDIDCETDAGVSRRQAFLTYADGYWFVNDLDSANGTYVAEATATPPREPITARTKVDESMRILVGAWTRIVVRPALKDEVAMVTPTDH